MNASCKFWSLHENQIQTHTQINIYRRPCLCPVNFGSEIRVKCSWFTAAALPVFFFLSDPPLWLAPHMLTSSPNNDPFPPPLVENLYTVSSRNAFQVFGVSLGFWKIPKVVKRRHLHIHHTNSSSITAASLLYLQERPSTMFRLVQNFCEKTLL